MLADGIEANGSGAERPYCNSRCDSLMLPWTVKLYLDKIGHEALYELGETDD